MSNLLERAIIDAKALREAALKSAEKLVIEKYSDEVRTAVNQLIEQEDPLGLGTDTDLGLGGTTGDDNFFDSPEQDFENSEEGEGEDEEGLDPESIVGGLPDAFDSDDEIVSIKLDSLEAEFEDEEDEIRFAGDNQFDDDEIGIDILNDEEIEDEEEFDFDYDDEVEDEENIDNVDDEDVGIDITDDIVKSFEFD